MFTAKQNNNGMRFDLQIIASWVEPGAKVLDLGCGEGDLLNFLKETKQVSGAGIEIDEDKVVKCIEKGLSVVQGDINEEIQDYPDGIFDYIIVSQTLQQVYEPAKLIQSILRIGKKGILSFPNFSHWLVRIQLLFTGFAPITKQLPYQWHDTPNIRVITLKDFRKFSEEQGFNIIREVVINTKSHDRSGKIADYFPNLRGTYGIFMIGD